MQKENFNTWFQQSFVAIHIQDYKNNKLVFLAYKDYKTYNKSKNQYKNKCCLLSL